VSGNIAFHFSDCEKVWGNAWKTLVMDAEKFLNKKRIDPKELALLINGLMKLESFVAEEYLTTACKTG